MADTLELKDLLNDVNEQKIVLPDFQRKFIWSLDDMYGLYASVLCQMPIGSILTLESNDHAFSCKKIGAKPRSCVIDLEDDKTVEFLLDGQQRLTSLFAGFTTYYFDNFKSKDKNNIAAERLHHLFFVKIPDENNKIGKDLFSARTLSFDSNWNNTGKSYVSSEELKKLLTSEHISKILKTENLTEYDLKNDTNLNEIKMYCCKSINGFYHVPLQFSLFTQGSIKSTLKKILQTISLAYSDGTEKGKEQADEWVDNVIQYLQKCLGQLQLNKIIVKNSDKARAIDIYSNLNKGGVALNVFDLIMAKVGTISKENYYDEIIKNIKQPIQYPNSIIKDSFIILLKNEIYNNPLEDVAKVVSSKDEINKEFINVFLNVMALCITQKERGEKDFNPSCTKRNEILDLDPQKIKDNTKKICTAISRAMLFFQNRCGIRTISDINYKAQLSVVAYFFMEDKYFNNEKIHFFFEYWYWITIFAYLYPSNQDIEIYKNIPIFEKYFESNLQDTSALEALKSFQKDVFNKEDYSDEKTLLMSPERRKNPPAIMSKYICQYCLSLGYKDFWQEDNFLWFLSEENFDEHHLMPLGSDPNYKTKKITLGATTKELRTDKDNPYNSPLNKLYITKAANKKISNMDYQTYSQGKEVMQVISQLGCLTTFDDNTTLETFFHERYNQLKSKINNRLDGLYHCLKQ